MAATELLSGLWICQFWTSNIPPPPISENRMLWGVFCKQKQCQVQSSPCLLEVCVVPIDIHSRSAFVQQQLFFFF